MDIIETETNIMEIYVVVMKLYVNLLGWVIWKLQALV